VLSATAARVLQNLAADEVAETRERLLQEKRSELEHYIQIALGSVKGLYDGAAQGDMARREQAIAILSKIKYGADGYFFSHDSNVVRLFRGDSPVDVGKSLAERHDPNGVYINRELVNQPVCREGAWPGAADRRNDRAAYRAGGPGFRAGAALRAGHGAVAPRNRSGGHGDQWNVRCRARSSQERAERRRSRDREGQAAKIVVDGSIKRIHAHQIRHMGAETEGTTDDQGGVMMPTKLASTCCSAAKMAGAKAGVSSS